MLPSTQGMHAKQDIAEQKSSGSARSEFDQSVRRADIGFLGAHSTHYGAPPSWLRCYSFPVRILIPTLVLASEKIIGVQFVSDNQSMLIDVCTARAAFEVGEAVNPTADPGGKPFESVVFHGYTAAFFLGARRFGAGFGSDSGATGIGG